MHLFYLTFINNSYKWPQKERNQGLWTLSSAPTKICTGTSPSTVNGQLPLSMFLQAPSNEALETSRDGTKPLGKNRKKMRAKKIRKLNFPLRGLILKWEVSTQKFLPRNFFKVSSSKQGSYEYLQWKESSYGDFTVNI